jgi:hypothetical protein
VLRQTGMTRDVLRVGLSNHVSIQRRDPAATAGASSFATRNGGAQDVQRRPVSG